MYLSSSHAMHKTFPQWKKIVCALQFRLNSRYTSRIFFWLTCVPKGLWTYVQSFVKIFWLVSDLWTSRVKLTRPRPKNKTWCKKLDLAKSYQTIQSCSENIPNSLFQTRRLKKGYERIKIILPYQFESNVKKSIFWKRKKCDEKFLG